MNGLKPPGAGEGRGKPGAEPVWRWLINNSKRVSI